MDDPFAQMIESQMQKKMKLKVNFSKLFFTCFLIFDVKMNETKMIKQKI
jgi:hypothetical protein